MIVIFEQDTRKRNGRRFTWKPVVFKGVWCGKSTWRIGWGLWSLSWYSSPGLRDFFRHAEARRAVWHSE